jgi:hypothetical protein
MLRVFYYSIFFSSAIAIIAFILNESFDNQVSWGALFWRILFCNLIFGLPLFVSLYKSNRFIIKQLSIDNIYIFLEYFDYDDLKTAKLPIKTTRIELIQWRNANSVYLKITPGNINIKQYRGGVWSADQLREIYKTLKEVQKRLKTE